MGRRFVALTVFGYVVALAFTYAAVTLVSTPSLRSMQKTALEDQAQTIAYGVEQQLVSLVSRLKAVAVHPDVIGLVIGDSDRSDRVDDFIRAYDAPDGLMRVTLHDFQGERIFDTRLSEIRISPYFDVEYEAKAAAMLRNFEPRASISFRPVGEALHGQFLIGKPILYNGSFEGVALFEFNFDDIRILNVTTQIGTARLATEFQVSMASEWSPMAARKIVLPIESTDLHVVFTPDDDAVAELGGTLVARVLLTLCVALIIPFGLMSAAGRRAIVTPHRDLARSREVLRQKQEELRELAAVAEFSNDAITVVDLNRRVMWMNAAAERLTGYGREEILGKSLGDALSGPESDPKVQADITAAIAARQPLRTEGLFYRANGTPYWSSVSIAPLTDAAGETYRYVFIGTDITESKRQQDVMLAAKKEVETQANHDHLTGLPNRRHLDGALEDPSLRQGDLVLIRVDLDHFKKVNDTLGHAAGDHVLREVSARLQRGVAPDDLVARVGGDEFVILLAAGRGPDEAIHLAEALLLSVQQDMQFAGSQVRVGASFGIAATHDRLLDIDNLLSGADAALYSAKERGRNAISIYSAELHAEVIENGRKAAEVEAALANGAFEPFFQPQVDAVTHEIVGVEALARWRHPEQGVLMPSEFLPIIERLSLTPELDALILGQGLAAMRDLAGRGLPVPKISFNVHSDCIEDTALADRVVEMAPKETLVAFEVLETILLRDPNQVLQFQVDRLKELGFQLEVDDFGSGHASIVGLMKLRPDGVKIDRRIVLQAPDSEMVRTLLKSMIDIGKSLGIRVAAEGVETATHARILTEMGCDVLQGHHFARPMDLDALADLLAQSREAANGANA